MKRSFLLGLSIPCILASTVTAQEPGPANIQATIDVSQAAPPVSRYEFGIFIEPIGQLVARSLWAEMLDDRKFYFPITSQPPAQPPSQVPMHGMALRYWTPVGGDGVVTMDAQNPFVGEHSPRIALEPGTPHGITQSGIALVRGKAYTGRIWLRGTPGTRVQVALRWGTEPAQQQAVTVGPLTTGYVNYPLHFKAGADASDASFTITAAGGGDMHVGAVSLMPADNIDGFRPDTIAALRSIHSGMWRLPGGNFLSNWSWYDAVGPIDKRPPMYDHAWNAMQTNDMGMDEWMTLCRLLGTEPYITVNAGFGDAHSAMEEVEYINGAATTRLGAERAKNGHPEPYHVKYWDIGNEPYGAWQLGHTTLEYYELKHNEFAAAMRKADPSITLLASGSMLEDMNLKGELRTKYTGNLKALEGGPEDWTGGLLAHCWGSFQGITEHWYASPGQRYDLAKARGLPIDAPTEDGYDKVQQTPLEYARYPANIVHLKAQEWEGYQQRFPQMIPAHIFLSMDEYAYFGRGHGETLESTLAYAMTLNEMMRHTSFLTMSARTMGTSMLDLTPTAAVLNTTGLLYQLFGEQFVGAVPVALTGNTPQPAPSLPLGGDQPKTNSGSPTYPLDMFAAESADHRSLIVSVVNATEQPQTALLQLAGGHTVRGGTQWQITGISLDAGDTVADPHQVTLTQKAANNAGGMLRVPPISVTVFRFLLE